MYIQDITLKNFRNYSELHLSFSPEINFIIGKNGVGKTNILEAIAIASNIKTFRNIHDSEIIRWDENAYYCSITTGSSDDHRFEVGCMRLQNSVKKKLKIDGKEIASAAEYYGRLLTVILSPDDITVINGAPDIRRRFFDGAISKIDGDYFRVLGDFKRVLASRNRLLKNLKNSARDNHQLDTWDQLFSEKASVLVTRRRSFTEYYNNIFQKQYSDIAGNDPVPCIRYHGSCESGEQDCIYRNLLRVRERDKILGVTTIGPQRDDYIIENEAGVKFINYASQGQRRTAAVAIKVAECLMIEKEKGKKAVILVDDIFSEFDGTRKTNVIDLLTRGNQIIFTMVHYDPESLSHFGHHKGILVSGNGEVTELM